MPNRDLKPIGVKAPLNLLPARPLRAISAAIEHGAIKYAPWNWQDKSQNEERVKELLAALLRHVTSTSDPSESDYDEESGLHHLAHAGACVMLLLYKLDIDYQPSKVKTSSAELGGAADVTKKPTPERVRGPQQEIHGDQGAREAGGELLEGSRPLARRCDR